MKFPCDFCQSDLASAAYAPDGAEGTKVFVCPHCGLVQSRQEEAGAGFAGKGEIQDSRAGAALSLLRGHCDLNRNLKILDIGAGRGNFVRALLSEAGAARVIAVEPDESRAWACRFLGRSEVVRKPIEQTHFEESHFDVVHCACTIEYLQSPLQALRGLRRAIKPGGLLIVETRNLRAIRDEGIVEEWFAAERRFHFSSLTIAKLLKSAGFGIVDQPDSAGGENLLVAAVKTADAGAEIAADGLEAASAVALISRYRAVRGRNVAVLAAVARELEALAPSGVALWGCGQLLDSLVRHGGLKRDLFRQFGGSELRRNEDLAALSETQSGTIVVMADTLNAEVERAVAERGLPARIVHYSDLFLRAHRRLAA